MKMNLEYVKSVEKPSYKAPAEKRNENINQMTDKRKKVSNVESFT